MDLSIHWLRDLLKIENPTKLPVTIIGFSQGGYMSPHVGFAIPETKLVIGLACEFRSNFIHQLPSFKLIAVHGELDDIVTPSAQKSEIDSLKIKGIEIDYHLIPSTGHEITTEMAKVVNSLLEAYGK
jgi:predicted esterase